jgi:hypothetical protein
MDSDDDMDYDATDDEYDKILQQQQRTSIYRSG